MLYGLRMIVRLLILAAAVGLACQSAAAQGEPECALPTEAPPAFDLTLDWGELDATVEYRLTYTLDLFKTRHTRGAVAVVDRGPTHVSLVSEEETETATGPLWRLARKAICGLSFDVGAIRYSFHSPVVELWLGYGDEALGARFLVEEAPPEAVELRGRIDELISTHRE